MIFLESPFPPSIQKYTRFPHNTLILNKFLPKQKSTNRPEIEAGFAQAGFAGDRHGPASTDCVNGAAMPRMRARRLTGQAAALAGSTNPRQNRCGRAFSGVMTFPRTNCRDLGTYTYFISWSRPFGMARCLNSCAARRDTPGTPFRFRRGMPVFSLSFDVSLATSGFRLTEESV